MRIPLYFILLLTIAIDHAFSQNKNISGKVIDGSSKEPLAFVNIIFNGKNQGTTTNIDGKFSIPYSEDIRMLKISYVGYEPFMIEIKDIPDINRCIIKLKKKIIDIHEVTVYPGINPAHRIINKAIGNRSINNPENLHSFSYTAYDKMIFTANLDTNYLNKRISFKDDTLFKNDTMNNVKKKQRSAKNDSIEQVFKKFLDYQDIMLMESVTERRFIHPDHDKENVIASKISGLKDPTFIFLATQFQSFSFYNDFISIYDKNYLNPLSKGSTGKYFFLIEDTLFDQDKDTIFIISFRPHKGKNFEGLKGVLYINSYKYAVQNVIAAPFEKKLIDIKIQQKYQLINHENWFPVELNTNIIFRNINISAGSMSTEIMALGKSYIRDIKINEDLNKKDFNNIELTIDDQANKKNKDFWDKFRIDSLTEKDKNTYRVIDSIGQKYHFDSKIKFYSNIMSGYLPFHFINIDLESILKFNYYEGLRLGLGLSTNELVSKWFSAGGYWAFGTIDKAQKYGANIDFHINKNAEMILHFGYKNDVIESGGYSFLEERKYSFPDVSEMFRNYLVKNMDLIEEKEATLSFRTLQYIKMRLFIERETRQTTDNYWWKYGENSISNIGSISYGSDKFIFTNAGVNFRFIYKEKFMQTTMGKYSLGSKYPVIYGNIVKGLDWGNGRFSYTKYECKISETFITKLLGRTNICITGGIVDKNIPYPEIYSGRSSYEKFAIESANSFETMRMNEFLSDRFASVFFRQDFGSLLLKTKNLKPDIIFCTDAGYGNLKFNSNHEGIQYKIMNKGYYESGIIINNFIRKFMEGIGVFYRYGPYSFSKVYDNFAFKLTIAFNLG